MKKILSIDFDIIMHPSIHLYNELAEHADWDYLQQNPLMQLMYGDLKLYNQLTNFLLAQTKKMPYNKIHFINSHENILKYLPKDEEFTLINIDQHHDLSYNNLDQKLSCSNWVKHCFYHYKIKDYIWVHSRTSQFPFGADNQLISESYLFSHYNYQTLEEYDEIIICFSKTWVPPNYQELFYNWIYILNTIYNYNFSVE